MQAIKIAYLLILILLLCQCNNSTPVKQSIQEHQTLNEAPVNSSPPAVIIQPFTGMPPEYANKLKEKLSAYLSEIKIVPSITLPPSAWYAPRKRYKADSIISFLSSNCPKNTVVIGLTHHDISTQKGEVKDYGIMGLGFKPGNACVISYFRLAKNNTLEQFLKLCLHELGHTQGLPHCPDKTCFMRDAEGKNHANEEKGFCDNCTAHLKSKGWKL